MSGEVMQFPKTVEEFMEEYKIVDSEQVYTNGTELVPIFRMKQWFEHMRHGKWIPYGDCGVTECSCCGWNIEECVGWNYCPNCGARMEGVEE